MVRWERERDDAAKVSAENGYIISECESVLPKDDSFKEHMAIPTRTRLGTLNTFPYTDEKLQWRDHHCMDAGAEYDLKHADLERSFGAKVSSLEIGIWSRIMPGYMRHRFKRKANGRDLSTIDIASKRRLLERSASAACLYFEGQSLGNSGNCTSGSLSHDVDSSLRSNDDDAASYSVATQFKGDGSPVSSHLNIEYSVGDRKVEVAEDVLKNKNPLEVDNKLNTDYVSRIILEIPCRSQMDSARDSFFFTLRNLSGKRHSKNCETSNEYLEADDIKTDVRLVTEVKNADNISDAQVADASISFSLTEGSSSLSFLTKYAPLSSQLGLSPAFKSFTEAWSLLLVNPWQRLKSQIGKEF